MGYVSQCADTFTPGQIEKMCAVFDVYRANVTETNLCWVDVEVSYDGNSIETEIFLENNGNHYHKIQGNATYDDTTQLYPEYLYEGPASLIIRDAGGDGILNGGGVTVYVYPPGGTPGTPIAYAAGDMIGSEAELVFQVPEGCVVPVSLSVLVVLETLKLTKQSFSHIFLCS